MRILKFGGSSVGTIEPLMNVKEIVTSRNESVIVVVSALGGITDLLLQSADLAGKQDPSYKDTIDTIITRHHELIDGLFGKSETKARLSGDVDNLLSHLQLLCGGVYTLRVLSDKTRYEIVSLGERLSALIVAALIDGSLLYDSLEFIRTTIRDRKVVLDSEPTEKLVKEAFSAFCQKGGIAIVPGFIARDSSTGEISNLGRGGSDYTASIIASALDAECLEIWTDVDGFMTADPRVITTSYVIDELSFTEALELCNFGAKVIYPPTLYPVAAKNIPILVRNTFNPKAPGTIIKGQRSKGKHVVTGISSIDNTSLLTITGTMVGIVGVNSRIFSTLTRNGISAFFASQSSSETSISIGVSSEDAELSKIELDREFAAEISDGSMNEVLVDNELATVAIVGENMKGNPGVAGKLFSTLGRNGISIIAFAQGRQETNISFVVRRNFLRKSLNVIHDSFFLSEFQELNLFICGIGTVGGRLIEQITSQREKLMRDRSLKLNIVGIARSMKGIFDRNGINPEGYRQQLEQGIDLTPSRLRDEVIGMNIFNSVFVDCTASADIAALYKDFFDHGISVVAANKVAASSPYDNYKMLKDGARHSGVKYLFETNVGAGLPVINTINDLVNSGDKILKIEAVLSGTLNFIFNTLSADIPFSQTVRMAKEQGFSEPDPRIDLSGKDVIRKLVILAREAGYKLDQSDVKAELFIPQDFFECSLDEFWKKLPDLDGKFEKERKVLEKENKRWKFVATMDDGDFKVSLRTVDSQHSFYNLEGSNNIILITTERYRQHPMMIQGYGAGADVTAAGVFADIMSIANI